MIRPYGKVGRPPTDCQMKVVVAIEDFWAATSMAPTVRELGVELGYSSTNGVMDIIKSLENRDMVYRTPGAARSLITSRMSVNVEIGQWPWDRGANENGV